MLGVSTYAITTNASLMLATSGFINSFNPSSPSFVSAFANGFTILAKACFFCPSSCIACCMPVRAWHNTFGLG